MISTTPNKNKEMLKISVIIPTYDRTEALKDCLEGIIQQVCLPNEIIIIGRTNDAKTKAIARKLSKLDQKIKFGWVKNGGQVGAINLGLKMASSEIIAITDDDAVPHNNWLSMIKSAFENDPNLGGYGGRDLVYENGKLAHREIRCIVGNINWFGRTIGNHHCGSGAAREVDFFKGVNMSFRKKALPVSGFDKRLQGEFAQTNNDLNICLKIKKRGWKLIYDPNLLVDHFPGKRAGINTRNSDNPSEIFNDSFNLSLSLFEYLPIVKKIIYLLYIFLVGTTHDPGLIGLFLCIIKGKKNIWKRFCSSNTGKIKALRQSATEDSTVLDYYNTAAAAYDSEHGLTEIEHEIGLAILSGLANKIETRSILDIGSGTGRAVKYLIENNTKIKRIIGIEPSAAMRDIGYKKGLSTKTIIDGSGDKILFGDKSFDIVCAFGVLHHVPDSTRVIKEMLRVARKAIFISDNNNYGEGSLAKRSFKQALRLFHLWKIFVHIKTRGKGYQVLAGDGPHYPYSLFDDLDLIRKKCKKVFLFDTTGRSKNLFRQSSHIAVLGVIDEK